MIINNQLVPMAIYNVTWTRYDKADYTYSRGIIPFYYTLKGL